MRNNTKGPEKKPAENVWENFLETPILDAPAHVLDKARSIDGKTAVVVDPAEIETVRLTTMPVRPREKSTEAGDHD